MPIIKNVSIWLSLSSNKEDIKLYWEVIYCIIKSTKKNSKKFAKLEDIFLMEIHNPQK